jgi:hypothetical protein
LSFFCHTNSYIHATVFFIACLFANAFAQNFPEKLAVYVSGASEASINKSLGNKLLVAMVQNSSYAEITDLGAFQDEIDKSGKSDMAQIFIAAKLYGADYVCAVNMIEAFGAYSLTARLIKISNLEIVKIGSADRSLKSLEDLTVVSNELARQLLPPGASPPPAPPAAVAPIVSSATPYAFIASGSSRIQAPATIDRVAVAQAATKKQCAKTYNINEILSNIKNGFPSQLKDCSSKLAKDMALSFIPGRKKPEPMSFMSECAVDGIRYEIPDGFPGADKIVGNVENFVQNILNSAFVGGKLDPKKLLSAVGSMNVGELLNDVKKLAAGNSCIVNEPVEDKEYESTYAESEAFESSVSFVNKSRVSFGIRTGFNFSHGFFNYYYDYYDDYDHTYNNITGMQVGFVIDFAARDWFHFQPGIMYIQKGMNDNQSDITAHYLEIPVLLSLKFSALRLNAGPYFGLCSVPNAGRDIFGNDFGFNIGLGFDIGMFYIGTFYDYGFTDMSRRDGFSFYNRTIGFNVGVNL